MKKVIKEIILRENKFGIEFKKTTIDKISELFSILFIYSV